MQSFREAILRYHTLYRLFRILTGSRRVNRLFIEQYVRPLPGEFVLDVGCGPADAFALLPPVNYVGIDMSEDYIAFARRRFGDRARFVCGDLSRLEQAGLERFDVAIAMGVIHHLSDDQVIEVLTNVRTLLHPGGRFVSYDPCFTEPQHPLARWIHRHDRGRFVRLDRNYEDLIRRVFPEYRKHIRTDLCTVPATVIIFDCPTG